MIVLQYLFIRLIWGESLVHEEKNMRTYELAALFRHEADIYQKGLEAVRNHIKKYGGTIVKEEDLGERALAYPIKKATSGHYMVFYSNFDPQQVDEFKKFLKLETSLLRFLMIKSEED
jgi:small subunit ribosomal protein S6